MSKKSIHTKVEGHQLKITNPQKVLYPAGNITKAEVIKYYLSVAQYLLPHIKGRPLSLIRFPDGIEENSFYAKNKPSWSPDWIASTIFEDVDYIMAYDKATLVWIANMAGLEIHPLNIRSPNLSKPDQYIFDLDPSPTIRFEEIKEIAINLKNFLLDYNYSSYVKTSGSKGLHIYIPIHPIYDQDEVYDTFEVLAKQFVKDNDKLLTLKISKTKRKDKVLLDIYRNRQSQSCVAPYSLRARPSAPVSMPITWEELERTQTSQAYNIHSATAYLQKNGDAWKDMWDNRHDLHTKRSTSKKELSEYQKKRNFNKTPEPSGNSTVSNFSPDAYVVQLHIARKKHYDLRLSSNGVLLSWALPKGMPHIKDLKRLAVRTEDHPIQYLSFEGSIPKGEYGAGVMWIFDKGRYEIIKKTEKKIHFRLSEGDFTGQYILYNTTGKQWILEYLGKDTFQFEIFLKPMLAKLSTAIPKGDHYLYEIKWDGIRAIFVIEEGIVKIFSRNGNDITNQFPELSIIPNQLNCTTAVLDGEIVYLDEVGKPDFSKLVSRLHIKSERKILSTSKKQSATVYLFDLLYLDGKDCRKNTNFKRRDWLRAIIETNDTIRYSESFDNGHDLFEAIRTQQMEGIICKKKDGLYRNNARNDDWLKVKVRNEAEAYIVGYTAGKGDRESLIGALHLAQKARNDSWIYRGKVGTGWDQATLETINEWVKDMPEKKKYLEADIADESVTTWIEPLYKIELSYASMSSNDTYREPVFKTIFKSDSDENNLEK